MPSLPPVIGASATVCVAFIIGVCTSAPFAMWNVSVCVLLGSNCCAQVPLNRIAFASASTVSGVTVPGANSCGILLSVWLATHALIVVRAVSPSVKSTVWSSAS